MSAKKPAVKKKPLKVPALKKLAPKRPAYKTMGRTSDGVTILAPKPAISTPTAIGRRIGKLMAQGRESITRPKTSAARLQKRLGALDHLGTTPAPAQQKTPEIPLAPAHDAIVQGEVFEPALPPSATAPPRRARWSEPKSGIPQPIHQRVGLADYKGTYVVKGDFVEATIDGETRSAEIGNQGALYRARDLVRAIVREGSERKTA